MQSNIQALFDAMLVVQTTDSSLQDQLYAAIASITTSGQAMQANIQANSDAISGVQTTDSSLQDQLSTAIA